MKHCRRPECVGGGGWPFLHLRYHTGCQCIREIATCSPTPDRSHRNARIFPRLSPLSHRHDRHDLVIIGKPTPAASSRSRLERAFPIPQHLDPAPRPTAPRSRSSADYHIATLVDSAARPGRGSTPPRALASAAIAPQRPARRQLRQRSMHACADSHRSDLSSLTVAIRRTCNPAVSGRKHRILEQSRGAPTNGAGAARRRPGGASEVLAVWPGRSDVRCPTGPVPRSVFSGLTRRVEVRRDGHCE